MIRNFWTRFLATIIFLCLLPVAAGSENSKVLDKLLGRWEANSEEGLVILEFVSENILVYNGEEIEYILGDGALQIEDDLLGYLNYPFIVKDKVLTITYPEGFSLRFTKVKSPAKSPEKTAAGGDRTDTSSSTLVAHFAGTWKNYTQYTETMIVLFPDGTYGERYTSSYGSSESGEEWGTAADRHAKGKWTVRGTKEKGTITIIDNDGSETVYQYVVHVENGETYWREYYFNDVLYGMTNE